jgi:DNA-binding Lrp family transcriptional regulator
MRDAVSAVDLATLAAAGDQPGALWRLDGEDLQANLIRLGLGDRIQPHRNDEVEVLMVVVAGRGELTLDGQVHPLAPMALVHVPKGTVRAVVAVDGPLAYLSVHRRRSSGLQVGRHAPHHPPNGHEQHRHGGPARRGTHPGHVGWHDPRRSLRVVVAYILIQTEVGKAAMVAEKIVEIEGVQQAEDVTGPYDVIVRAEARNIDELGKLVVARVQAVDGITRTLTCPVVHL